MKNQTIILLVLLCGVLIFPILYFLWNNGTLPSSQGEEWSRSADYTNAVVSPLIQIANLVFFIYITYQLHGLSQKNEAENLKVQKQSLDLNRQIAMLQLRNEGYAFIRNDLDPLLKKLEILPADDNERLAIVTGVSRRIDDTILRYSVLFNDLYETIEYKELSMAVSALSQFNPRMQREVIFKYDILLKRISKIVLDTAFDQTYKDFIIAQFLDESMESEV